MDELALRVLDRIPKDTNIYRLVLSLTQRCLDLSKIGLGGQRVNWIEEAFGEELARTNPSEHDDPDNVIPPPTL
jgi:hypothetical protein